jgi:hypothetical protein
MLLATGAQFNAGPQAAALGNWDRYMAATWA